MWSTVIVASLLQTPNAQVTYRLSANTDPRFERFFGVDNYGKIVTKQQLASQTDITEAPFNVSR